MQDICLLKGELLVCHVWFSMSCWGNKCSGLLASLCAAVAWSYWISSHARHLKRLTKKSFASSREKDKKQKELKSAILLSSFPETGETKIQWQNIHQLLALGVSRSWTWAQTLVLLGCGHGGPTSSAPRQWGLLVLLPLWLTDTAAASSGVRGSLWLFSQARDCY